MWGELQQCSFRHSGTAALTQILWRSLNFLGSEFGKFQWTFCHFTGQTVAFFTWHSSLSSSCCNLLIWEHQLSSSSLLTAEKTNIHFKLFHIHVVFRHLTFLSVFWPGEIKCLIIHSYRLIKAWPHILPVVGVAEWETGDMQTWLWTLRAHRLPLFCVAVCCTAVTSLLQRKP